jgi:tetratricopeptide (TPR) repeat protein
MFTVFLDGRAADMSGGMTEAAADTYSRDKDTHAVVLLSVNWGRHWNFCGAENVQLRTFAFDRVPVLKRGDDEAADLLLKAPPSLTAGPGEVAQYALIVEPGEYALSYSELKVARSVSKVDTYAAGRKSLIRDGNSLWGSFKAGAGELVYVGHISTDCVDRQPMIWRYYIDGRENFQEYLATDVKPKYPFLDTETVQYRPVLMGSDAYTRANDALDTGNYAEALGGYTQALDQAKDEGNEEHRAMAMYGLARTNARLCRVTDAEKWFRDSIALREAMPDRGGTPVIQNYSEFARFLLSRGRPSDAVEYFGRAVPRLEKMGIEKTDPIGYANYLDDYVGAMRSIGMDGELEPYATKAAKLRSKYPDRQANFRPMPYPVNCEEKGN